MPFLHLRSALPCVLALVALLQGCSEPQEAAQVPEPGAQSVHHFSEEDQLAARALSISNRGAVQESDTPYAHALACSSAIEALTDRLRQSDTLTAEQLRVVEQAKAVYDRRARLLRTQMEAANPAARETLQQIPEEIPPGGRALQAIGCLQKLAEAS